MRAAGSGAEDNAVSLARLFIDGRRAQPAQLQLEGAWEPALDWPAPREDNDAAQRSGYWKWWTDSPGWRARWNHAASAAPASISFTASSAAVLFDRLGHCGALTISDGADRVWSDTCPRPGARYRRYVAVELPMRAGASRWMFALWLLAVLLVAAAVRPWANDRRLELWLILFVAVLQVLAWCTQDSGIVFDSLLEMPTISRWATGYPGYMPPGYPLLVGFGYLLSRPNAGTVITLIQHSMMIASVCWCFRLVRRSVGPLPAFAAGLAAGAAAPIIFLPQTLQSENVAIFGMAGALYFAAGYAESAGAIDLVLSAVLLAWGTMARIAPLAAGVPAIFVVMLGAKPAARGLWRFAAVMAIAAVLLAIPLAWFGAESGHLALSSSAGHHLYDRVVSGEGLLDQTAPNTARLLRLLAPLSAADAADIRRAPGRHPDFERILEKQGLDYWDVDGLLRDAALEGIRKAPMAFIGYSLHQAWTQYFDDPTPMLTWWAVPPAYPPELDARPIFGVRANSLLWRHILGRQFAVIWLYVPWLAIIGCAMLPALRERRIFLAVAMLPLGYVLALGLLEVEVPRYTVAIVPFVFALAAGPFAALLRLTGAVDAGRARGFPNARAPRPC